MIGRLLKQTLPALLCSAVTLCTTVTADNRDKYLPAAGPTPLRFAVEMPEFNPAWLLPALDMGEAKATTKAAEEPKPTSEVKNEGAQHPAVEPEKPIEVPNASIVGTTDPIQPNAAIEPPKTEIPIGPVSSQMLLRYFSRGGTNEILVPYNVEFTPPVKNGGPGSGSSAIYISE